MKNSQKLVHTEYARQVLVESKYRWDRHRDQIIIRGSRTKIGF